MSEHYYGISFAILASILWSITVTLIKPITNNISPFLINPIKNSIGFLLFSRPSLERKWLDGTEALGKLL